ncbi:MAG TPA: response regulator [Nitrospiraceae bacterium]|nr:response regulator [Nitrospiraceae bacterium]
MKDFLRALHLEDNPLDSELIESMLVGEGIPCRIQRVTTRMGFVQALERDQIDVILSDVSVPAFNGMEALAIVRKTCPHIPFIFVTGTVGEETAIETLKSGAKDYVLKQRLSRLVPSVKRALREAEERNKRKRTEDLLREREQLFRLIMENTTDLIAVLDIHGRRVYNNRAYQALLGTQEPLRGTDSFREVHPDDQAAIRMLFFETVETGIGKRTEYRLVVPDGRVRLIESQDNVIRDAAGAVVNVVVVSRDITERKQAEEALRRSEHWLRTILDSEPACVMIVGRDGLIEEMNPAGLAMVETASEVEAIGHPILPFIHTEEQETFSCRHRDALAGSPQRFQCRLVTLQGTVRWIEAYAVPFGEDQREPMSVLIVARDITESRKMEAQLQQALKMEAIGRLAGGVAHDFNNMLTGISGHGDLLLRQLPSESPLRRHAEEIKQSCKRCAALTNQLLTFSRSQVLQPKIMDISRALIGMESMLRPLIGEDVILRIHAETAPAHVRVDPTQLEQIVLNLSINARDAMPNGGLLTIETATVMLDGAAVAHREIRPGVYLRLSVQDTGTGMDEQTMLRIFEPFFTTKEPGKGTGLGLSTVYGIVQQSGGWIEVDSIMGKGSTFLLFFPIMDGAGQRSSVPGHGQLGHSDPKAILVVEDDPVVRGIIQEVLSLSGYRVVEAANGEEAIARCRHDDGHFDLLLTDVVMPHLGGRQLAQQLHGCYPQMKILFMSGHLDDAILREGLSREGMAFLPKPFTPEALEQKIRDILLPPG